VTTLKLIFVKPKYYNIFLTIIITSFICFLLFNAKLLSYIIKDNIELFLYNLLPAIFPFILLTNILIQSSMAYNLSYGLSTIVSKIFNISNTSCPAIIIGMLLGYPNSAIFLSHLYLKNKISSKELEKLLAYTSNANPSFIISTIGISFYSNIKIGIILLVSHFLSSIILGISLRNVNINIIQQNTQNRYTLDKKKHTNMFNIITNSIFNTIKTLGIVFSFTVIFAIISSIICNIFSFSNLGDSIITAFIELTNGMKKLSCINLNINKIIILSSFFLSFGSLMIIYQIYAIVHKCNVSIFKFIFYKIIHGILSAITSYILLMVIKIEYISIPTFSNTPNIFTYVLPELVYILTITIITIYICFKKPKKILSKSTVPIDRTTKRPKYLTVFKGDNV